MNKFNNCPKCNGSGYEYNSPGFTRKCESCCGTGRTHYVNNRERFEFKMSEQKNATKESMERKEILDSEY